MHAMSAEPLDIYLSTRVWTSCIFKYSQNSQQCRTLRSDKCYSTLDHASTTLQLKIKEAIHNQWEQPTLTH